MKKVSKKFLLIFLIGISLFCFSGCNIQKVGLYLCYSDNFVGSHDRFVASLGQDKVYFFYSESNSIKLDFNSIEWGSLVLPAYSSARIEVDDKDMTTSFIKMKDSKEPSVIKFLEKIKGREYFGINENSLIIENFFKDVKEKGVSIKIKVIFYK